MRDRNTIRSIASAITNLRTLRRECDQDNIYKAQMDELIVELLLDIRENQRGWWTRLRKRGL